MEPAISVLFSQLLSQLEHDGILTFLSVLHYNFIFV